MTFEKQPDHATRPDVSKTTWAKSRFLAFPLGFALFLLAGWALWPAFSGQTGLAQKSGSQSKLEGPAGAAAHSEDLPFLIMRQQPDHVLFAPAAHSRDMCNQCHNFSEEKYLEIFKASREAADLQKNSEQAKPQLEKPSKTEQFDQVEQEILGQKEQALLYQPKP